MSGSGDADEQQSPRCSALRLGFLISKKTAPVLPLDEQDTVELFALGFVNGHEHTAAGVALVGLKHTCLERATYQIGGPTVTAMKIPSRSKAASDLISCTEESNELGVRP